jgi:hypothetical protein
VSGICRLDQRSSVQGFPNAELLLTPETIDIIKPKGGGRFNFKVVDRIAFSGRRQSTRSGVGVPEGPFMRALS